MGTTASGIFVGRGHELGQLERALDTVRAGSGTTGLVTGDAGIGKTRLASELAARARDAGFEVLLGRAIDLVGTELPYQPFVEALRPLGGFPQVDGQAAGSQLRVFQETLALLSDRAATAPLLLVLEDLHWADTSTLDLVVFLAHNLGDRRVLLLATCRADEPASAERVRRLADGVRRSGSALVVELGPLDREELTALLEAHAGAPPPAALTDAILARSEGNPFYAEELFAAGAGERGGELPRGLREVLLQRVARLDRRTQGLLRLAAAAGRDVGYPLLRDLAALPEADVRESLRQAVEHGVLVAEQATGSFRFRHALLAEAVYATLLPGEREELHARLAEELARGAAAAAELAPHWAGAGRSAEALAASVEAARQAEAVFGLAEALAHLERALALWPAVPEAAELVRLDLAGLCAWAAERASQTGAAPRAVQLAQQAIELVEERDPLRAARLYDRLGRYLHESGKTDLGLAAFEHVVDLVPLEPPSPARAHALAALGHGLTLAWRFDEAQAVCEQALALARTVGADAVELRALLDLGQTLAYLGRADEGVALLWRALELAEERGGPFVPPHAYVAPLEHAYVLLTGGLTMRGRPRESARLGQRGLEAVRRYGIDSTVLVANTIEALLAIGEWDSADSLSAAALRTITANFPYMLLMLRADLEVGRGHFEAARAHLEAALATLREDRGLGIHDVCLAELALWERRWTDADQAVRDGLARARSQQAAQLRVWFCAKGLRAQAELAALARARRDTGAVRTWLDRAGERIAVARGAAVEAAAVTPNAAGWLAVAEAEHERARGVARPDLWADAADTWERLERPPLAAYCRWRQAEALVAAGASRAAASEPLSKAHAVAARIGAKPLAEELWLLTARARLELAPEVGSPDGEEGPLEPLGLTPREAEVLGLLARGCTNREIAEALVISVRTAGVHVSHILRKLGAPNRLEAAAIAHRFGRQARR